MCIELEKKFVIFLVQNCVQYFSLKMMKIKIKKWVLKLEISIFE